MQLKLNRSEQRKMAEALIKLKSEDPKKVRESNLPSTKSSNILKRTISLQVEAWFQEKYGDITTMNYGEAWRV